MARLWASRSWDMTRQRVWRWRRSQARPRARMWSSMGSPPAVGQRPARTRVRLAGCLLAGHSATHTTRGRGRANSSMVPLRLRSGRVDRGRAARTSAISTQLSGLPRSAAPRSTLAPRVRFPQRSPTAVGDRHAGGDHRRHVLRSVMFSKTAWCSTTAPWWPTGVRPASCSRREPAAPSPASSRPSASARERIRVRPDPSG
jgi:hypothetical protein